MEKKRVASLAEDQRKEAERRDSIPPNDGTNTPVPGKKQTKKLSKTEEALFKQAENPLGDPHKI